MTEKLKKTFSIIFFYFFVGFLTVQAQYIEPGLAAGFSWYQGELSADKLGNQFQLFRPQAGIFVRYNVNDYFSTRLNFNYASIKGDDAIEGRSRNLNFKSTLMEFGLTAEFNVLGYQPYALYRVFSPYLFAGVAGFSFNPQGELDGDWHALQPLGTEGQGLNQYPERKAYSRLGFALPFGAGVKYAVNDKWNVGIQVGARYTFTDYLDDVSTTYISDGEMLEGNGELAAALANKSGTAVLTGQERGDDSNNDWYMIAEIFVSYNLFDNGLVGSRGRSRGRRGCY